jgi:7-carboxy-7-deazaguanine synthase
VSRINLQPIEKQELSDEGILQVHSIWPTIQGEGPYAGTPAVFLRLAGCNLTCPGCDTDYTSTRVVATPQKILQQVQGFRKDGLIVITGGEPFRQNFAPFARLAVYSGYRVQVETNGTLWFEEFYPSRFTVVCSPKTPKIQEELKRHISALKYVVKAGEIDPSDGLPTSILENGLRPARPWPKFGGEIYVQPYDEDFSDPINEDTKNAKNIEAAVESCMKFGYRLCLQVHKLVGLP